MQDFDAYVEAGGNFIDTSINYTNGSAKVLGEFIASDRNNSSLHQVRLSTVKTIQTWATTART
jgi:aryl-alcohol dehydrogenase-like predicted oxidoreductase